MLSRPVFLVCRTRVWFVAQGGLLIGRFHVVSADRHVAGRWARCSLHRLRGSKNRLQEFESEFPVSWSSWCMYNTDTNKRMWPSLPKASSTCSFYQINATLRTKHRVSSVTPSQVVARGKASVQGRLGRVPYWGRSKNFQIRPTQTGAILI